MSNVSRPAVESSTGISPVTSWPTPVSAGLTELNNSSSSSLNDTESDHQTVIDVDEVEAKENADAQLGQYMLFIS